MRPGHEEQKYVNGHIWISNLLLLGMVSRLQIFFFLNSTMFSMCRPRITNSSAPRSWENNINVKSGGAVACGGLQNTWPAEEIQVL